MNNKGFTLIELIATIALLAIIAIISFVSINEVIKQSKVSDCENLVRSIKSAAKEYVSDNRYTLTNNNDLVITADYLINGKYLSSSLINPFTNEEITPVNVNISIKLKADYTVSNEEDSIIVKNSSGNKVNCDNEEW